MKIDSEKHVTKLGSGPRSSRLQARGPSGGRLATTRAQSRGASGCEMWDPPLPRCLCGFDSRMVPTTRYGQYRSKEVARSSKLEVARDAVSRLWAQATLWLWHASAGATAPARNAVARVDSLDARSTTSVPGAKRTARESPGTPRISGCVARRHMATEARNCRKNASPRAASRRSMPAGTAFCDPTSLLRAAVIDTTRRVCCALSMGVRRTSRFAVCRARERPSRSGRNKGPCFLSSLTLPLSSHKLWQTTATHGQLNQMALMTFVQAPTFGFAAPLRSARSLNQGFPQVPRRIEPRCPLWKKRPRRSCAQRCSCWCKGVARANQSRRRLERGPPAAGGRSAKCSTCQRLWGT